MQNVRYFPGLQERAQASLIPVVDMSQDESLFDFPCQFPIKVMGLSNETFEIEVVKLVRKHVPDLAENAVTRRESAKSNYAALTITITATSREQLDAIYGELTASEHVIMAL
jgi:putative lipoic acid-binding regulatory protein